MCICATPSGWTRRLSRLSSGRRLRSEGVSRAPVEYLEAGAVTILPAAEDLLHAGRKLQIGGSADEDDLDGESLFQALYEAHHEAMLSGLFKVGVERWAIGEIEKETGALEVEGLLHRGESIASRPRSSGARPAPL